MDQINKTKTDPESEDGGIDMKVSMEFNLPEDQREFDLAGKSMSTSLAIREFDQYLRNEVKYNSHKYSEAELITFIAVREELRKMFVEYRVDFIFD